MLEKTRNFVFATEQKSLSVSMVPVQAVAAVSSVSYNKVKGYCKEIKTDYKKRRTILKEKQVIAARERAEKMLAKAKAREAEMIQESGAPAAV